jgi:hypothetical protein
MQGFGQAGAVKAGLAIAYMLWLVRQAGWSGGFGGND